MLALPSISVSTLSISLASQESKADHLSVMPVCGRLKIRGSFLRAFKLLPGKATGAISLVCCTLFPFISGVRNSHPNRGIRRNLLTSPIPREFPECFHYLPEKPFFRPGKQSAHRGDFPLEQGPRCGGSVSECPVTDCDCCNLAHCDSHGSLCGWLGATVEAAGGTCWGHLLGVGAGSPSSRVLFCFPLSIYRDHL